MSDEKNLTTVEDAKKFILDNSSLVEKSSTEWIRTMEKTDTRSYYKACGIPESVQKTMNDARTKLIEASMQVSQDDLVDMTKKDKKSPLADFVSFTKLKGANTIEAKAYGEYSRNEKTMVDGKMVTTENIITTPKQTLRVKESVKSIPCMTKDGIAELQKKLVAR